MSVDGFVATPDGRPALLSMPDFVPGESYGHQEFSAQCAAVVMGRTTFEPALGAPRWPWPGKEVNVLTSRALPPESAAQGAVAATDGPAALLERLRAADLDGDVQLLGGPRTIQAFRALGAIDRLELIVLPILLGDGLPLFPSGGSPLPLRLLDRRVFPDGAVELDYELNS